MEIKVNLLEKQKIQAQFDGFSVIADQPLSNNGDNSAPSPFDYFLASTALCAGYFVKAYCQPRNLPTEEISITQTNVKDPENKYKHTFNITIQVPSSFSEKDRNGLLKAVEGCSVKKAIQQIPDFKVEVR